MDTKIIDKIINSLADDPAVDEEVCPYFSDNSYKPVKVNKENFHSLNGGGKGRICFIDGGNAELIKSANNSLQLIRIYYTIYSGNKRISSKKIEFFVLISSEKKDGKVVYSAKFFEDILGFGELMIDPFDETIKTGIHQAKITTVGGIIRRFSELKVAADVVNELSANDLIVLDGLLQASVTDESAYLNNLYAKASSKGVIVSGLSKTSTLLATNGMSFVNIISSLAPKGKWYYHPVAEINNPAHQADISFIKLNEKSRYIFRFELYKKQQYDLNKIVSLLENNSRDPVFIGYPYGLIEADRFARVSNQERDYLKIILQTKLKDKWDGLNILNAHDILDRIG
ncbi:DNA double-strand break repair nuclease NurA [Candidatus Woesearchaeota archaeon]|nr:DNA double-strand break repair nuclease NurA [Candidatus Woesearchaeota archaeon]